MAAGISQPRDVSAMESEPENREGEPPIKTEVAEMSLSMFRQGSQTRVRIGNAHNSSELYEGVYETADEANNAMLDAGVLKPEQVADAAEAVGTGVALSGVTVEQMEAAGLKRHGGSNL
jgi:hypothetical protein